MCVFVRVYVYVCVLCVNVERKGCVWLGCMPTSMFTSASCPQEFASRIIANLAHHKANRTKLYMHELRLKGHDTRKLEHDMALTSAPGSGKKQHTLAKKKKRTAKPQSQKAKEFLEWTEKLGAATTDQVCSGVGCVPADDRQLTSHTYS